MSKDVEKLLQELNQKNKELNEALEKDRSEIVKLRQQKIEAEEKAELAKNEENKAKQEAAKAISDRKKAQEFQKGEYQALIKELFEKPQKELTSHIINESAESKRITLRTFIISLVVSLTITILASAFSLLLSSQASRENEERIKEIISIQFELANKVPDVSSRYFDLNFSPKQQECAQGASDLLKILNSSKTKDIEIKDIENGALGVKDNNRVLLTCSNNRLLSYITGFETINVKGFPSNNVNSLQDEIVALLPICLPLTEDFDADYKDFIDFDEDSEDFNHEKRWRTNKNAKVGKTTFGNSKSITFLGDGARYIVTKSFDSSDWVNISFQLIIGNEKNEREKEDEGYIALGYKLDQSGWEKIKIYNKEDYQDWKEITAMIPTEAKTKETRFGWWQIGPDDGKYDQWALDNIIPNPIYVSPLSF